MTRSEQDRNRGKLQGFLEDKLKWHDYTHLVVADEDMDPAAWFLHTIGLARSGQAELIVTGTLDHALAMDVIADVVAYGRRTSGLADGQQPGPAVRIPVRLRDVSTPFVIKQRVAQASSRFGDSIGVLQILWADGAGRFPDDPAYDQAGCPQQMLRDIAPRS